MARMPIEKPLGLIRATGSSSKKVTTLNQDLRHSLFEIRSRKGNMYVDVRA